MSDSPERAGRLFAAMVWRVVLVMACMVLKVTTKKHCSINLEVVSMIDAAKVWLFSQPCKKNNLVDGSYLLGTVFNLFYKLDV